MKSIIVRYLAAIGTCLALSNCGETQFETLPSQTSSPSTDAGSFATAPGPSSDNYGNTYGLPNTSTPSPAANPTPTPMPPTPPLQPSAPSYTPWTVETNNNLPNGRGHWSSRIIGAQPRAAAYFRMITYRLNGQPQSLSEPYQLLGITGPDGNYFWGGTVYCPTGMSCDFEWEIVINGDIRILRSTLRP